MKSDIDLMEFWFFFNSKTGQQLKFYPLALTLNFLGNLSEEEVNDWSAWRPGLKDWVPLHEDTKTQDIFDFIKKTQPPQVDWQPADSFDDEPSYSEHREPSVIYQIPDTPEEDSAALPPTPSLNVPMEQAPPEAEPQQQAAATIALPPPTPDSPSEASPQTDAADNPPPVEHQEAVAEGETPSDIADSPSRILETTKLSQIVSLEKLDDVAPPPPPRTSSAASASAPVTAEKVEAETPQPAIPPPPHPPTVPPPPPGVSPSDIESSGQATEGQTRVTSADLETKTHVNVAEMGEMERRTHRRFRTRTRVVISDGKTSFTSYSMDVSLGGIRLEHAIPKDFAGKKCEIYLNVGKSRQPLVLHGVPIDDKEDRIQLSAGGGIYRDQLQNWFEMIEMEESAKSTSEPDSNGSDQAS